MIVELASVGSTNDWLAAERDPPDGLWVRADVQTGGKGRRGRVWVSQRGNLFASTLIRDRPGEGPPQQLSFVAALAVADALDAWVAADRLTLKWPNDVLLDGVKCTGILLERHEATTIIGIGVNLAHHPEDTERPAISLAAAGIPAPSPTEVVRRLADAFDALRALWRGAGFGPIRTAWLAHTTGLGAPIIARLPGGDVSGTFEDLAPDGALQLRLADGTLRPIHAGEVFAA